MPACLIRSLGFADLPAASLKMDEDLLLPQSPPSPLRRTHSAEDLTSEKWISISQTGIKKVPSVENLHLDDDDNRGPIEEESKESPKQAEDIWSSIISQKATEEEGKQGTSDPPPYIHPLVKRSASTLSEKSLEICTESLGSETGSDGFYPPCEGVDSDHEEIEDEPIGKEITEEEKEEVRVCGVRVKKGAFVGARSFPPPLPSLAHRGDGSNVQMRSHRHDGRLVLEAVSVPTHACLRAERQDGRLLLLFSDTSDTSELPADVDTEPEDEDEVIFSENWDHQENDSDEEEDEEEEEQFGYGGGLGHKFLALTRNSAAPAWPRGLNKVVTTLDDEDEDVEEEEEYVEVGGESLMNRYVYSWRSKAGPAVVAAKGKKEEERGINKLLQVDRHYGRSAVVEVVVEGKAAGKGGEDLVPLFLRGCNLQQHQPAKKSLLTWEPRCIAT